MSVDFSGLPKCPLHPAFTVLPDASCPECGWKPEPEETGTEIAAVDEVLTGEIVSQIEIFEGAEVSEWELKLQGTNFNILQSYKRGSVLKLEVEVRLKNVAYMEKSNGTMLRIHHGLVEDVKVVEVVTPENVAGSASGDIAEEEEDGREA